MTEAEPFVFFSMLHVLADLPMLCGNNAQQLLGFYTHDITIRPGLREYSYS